VKPDCSKDKQAQRSSQRLLTSCLSFVKGNRAQELKK
jgi:hypothetical protein